jgi:hypothetical protein
MTTEVEQLEKKRNQAYENILISAKGIRYLQTVIEAERKVKKHWCQEYCDARNELKRIEKQYANKV